MSVMPPEPAHARPKPSPAGGIGAAWAILIGMGATSVTYNVVHAVHGGALNIALALVYGIAPVYGAALLSHVVAVHGGGRFMQAITFLLMLGAMGLSIGATAAVVRPVAGVWMQWLFGIVIDGASLVALRVILNDRTRRATAAAEIGAAQEQLQAALAEAREAVQDRSRLEQDRAELQAELATVKAELGAELEAVREELRTAREAVPKGGSRKRSSAAPKAPRTAPEDDLALEARALELLATDLNMTGAELARKLGVTEGYGRKLRRKLTAPDRPVDRPGPPAQDRSQDRHEDRT